MSKLPIANAVPIVSGAPLGYTSPSQVAPRMEINEAGARDFLTRNKWPKGLQESFLKGLALCPIRYIIVDDSGSMGTDDGSKLMGTQFVSCSRWSELGSTMLFHAALAEASCGNILYFGIKSIIFYHSNQLIN
jgi:hypothetical protein